MSTRAYKWTSNDGWRVRVVPGADIATLRLKMSHTTRGGKALFLVEIDDLDAAAIRGLKIAVPRGNVPFVTTSSTVRSAAASRSQAI